MHTLWRNQYECFCSTDTLVLPDKAPLWCYRRKQYVWPFQCDPITQREAYEKKLHLYDHALNCYYLLDIEHLEPA
jgi:hypothetical protein